jgi:hypothetical protein
MMLGTYRLRVYEDDNYEVLVDRVHLAALDLDTPAGLMLARVELEGLRSAIARSLKTPLDRVRLSVHETDQDGGAYVMDWLGNR